MTEDKTDQERMAEMEERRARPDDALSVPELAARRFYHLGPGDFDEWHTDDLIEEIFISGFKACRDRYGWKDWTVSPPPLDGLAKLIVFYRGDEKHLGVCWRDIGDFLTEQNIAVTDRLAYWMYLTDPEVSK